MKPMIWWHDPSNRLEATLLIMILKIYECFLNKKIIWYHEFQWHVMYVSLSRTVHYNPQKVLCLCFGLRFSRRTYWSASYSKSTWLPVPGFPIHLRNKYWCWINYIVICIGLQERLVLTFSLGKKLLTSTLMKSSILFTPVFCMSLSNTDLKFLRTSALLFRDDLLFIFLPRSLGIPTLSCP